MPSVKTLAVTVLLLPLWAGCVKRPVDYQREYAQSLRPAELEGPRREEGAPTGPPRVLRARAWVDQDFQDQTPRWRDRVEEQVRRANKVLEPQFGCRIELVQVVAWRRASRPPELERALGDLARTDPGRDVDLVIGYVSAVRMPTAVTESLGMAELDGRHFVLRSMVWVEEFDELERALDLLSFDERSELERERRVHREAAIFLHEWGHLMGAGHESLSASIMADLYHPQAVAFSPGSSRIIETTLRAGPRRAAVAEAAAPEPPAPPPVTPREAGTGPAPRGPGAPLPAHLQPLPTALPRPASGAAAAVMNGAGSTDTLSALAAREASLQAGGSGPNDWLQLARQASRLKAPALAERAARRAGPAPGAAFLAEDSRRQRLEVALPLDGSIAPPREPAYLDGVNGVLDHVAEERLPKAREALRRLGGTFPGSPGLALATCSVVEAERQATAASACRSAVQAFDEAPRAHLLLGAVHGRASRWAEARDQFLRAMALDDGTGEVWARLSGALGHLGDTAAQRELAERYQAKFGLALRPARD